MGWLAPDEWLLTGHGKQAFEMETKLSEYLTGHYPIVNVNLAAPVRPGRRLRADEGLFTDTRRTATMTTVHASSS